MFNYYIDPAAALKLPYAVKTPVCLILRQSLRKGYNVHAYRHNSIWQSARMQLHDNLGIAVWDWAISRAQDSFWIFAK
jgi:hypothetical protein